MSELRAIACWLVRQCHPLKRVVRIVDSLPPGRMKAISDKPCSPIEMSQDTLDMLKDIIEIDQRKRLT